MLRHRHGTLNEATLREARFGLGSAESKRGEASSVMVCLVLGGICLLLAVASTVSGVWASNGGEWRDATIASPDGDACEVSWAGLPDPEELQDGGACPPDWAVGDRVEVFVDATGDVWSSAEAMSGMIVTLGVVFLCCALTMFGVALFVRLRKPRRSPDWRAGASWGARFIDW